MAGVPQYQPNVAERPILQTNLTTRATPQDMGADIGAGLQSVSRGLEVAGQAMGQLQELEWASDGKRQEAALANWAMEAQYGENGFMNLSGGNAVAAQDGFLRSITEARMKFGQELSPGARRYYEEKAQALELSLKESALVHGSRQGKAYYNDMSDARQAMATDLALANWQVPGKIEESLQLGLGEIREQAALNGWDGYTTQFKEQQFTSAVTSGVALRMAIEDPIAAAQYMLDNSDKLTADEGFVLSTKLLPLVGEAAGREAYDVGFGAPLFNPGATPADVIRHFEGFATTAYNDPQLTDTGQQRGPNIYRAGYGSDQITRADGSVVKVTAGMTVTREDAERDLMRRIGEFQIGIVNDIGAEAWAGLDQSTQSALSSVAFNYGSLPRSVVAAVATGDRVAIANAIQGLAGHNGGINANRRAQEAALVLQGTGAGVTLSPRVETLLADLPANAAVMVRESAVQQLTTQRTAATAAEKAEYERYKDGLGLSILTGEVTSEQVILSDMTLNDGDKQTLLRSFRSENEDLGKARYFLSNMESGTAPVLNPYSTADQALFDKSFDLLISELPDEQVAGTVTAFIAETKMIPKTLVAEVRNGLASGSVKDVATGMAYAAILADKAPTALGNIENGKEIQDAAAAYAELVGNQGLTAEQAAQKIITDRLPENVKKAEVLKPLWDQAVRDKVFAPSDVISAFDTNGWAWGEPRLGLNQYAEAALMADYLDAAQRAFNGSANGDINIAKATALAEMKRTYAVSTVSGSEVVTKFAPELFYPSVAGSHDYLRDLAFADARSVVPDVTNVNLVWAPETSQDIRAGKAPRYNLVVTMPDGVQDMLPGLFVIDEGTLTELTNLDSEDRHTRFEMGRAYEEALRARPNDRVLSALETMPVGGVRKPEAADIVPGYADLEARLVEVEQKRRALLGQNAIGATVMTQEQVQAEAPGQEQTKLLMEKLYGAPSMGGAN